IGHPGVGVAGECVEQRDAGSVFDATLALLGALREPREAGAPAGVVADLAAELEEQVGRREPLHLQSVLPVLAAEHGLVHQWLVDEVPGVRVYFVEIAEAREEAPALQGET